jgi:hypothetical protein
VPDDARSRLRMLVGRDVRRRRHMRERHVLRVRLERRHLLQRRQVQLERVLESQFDVPVQLHQRPGRLLPVMQFALPEKRYFFPTPTPIVSPMVKTATFFWRPS